MEGKSSSTHYLKLSEKANTWLNIKTVVKEKERDTKVEYGFVAIGTS